MPSRAACLLAALASAAALPAPAQTADPCDWRASAWNIVEPWSAHSREFANGDVRLALLDTVEPAAGAFHILILSPPYDELGARQCRTLGAEGTMGFSSVAFDRLDATYHPTSGLTFTVPVERFDPVTGGFDATLLTFTVNQSTGVITAGTQ